MDPASTASTHRGAILPSLPHSTAPPLTRRDFLHVATASFGAVGAALAIWPLIDQMAPDAAVLAQGGPTDIDISKIAPGQQIIVRWRGRPIFIVNRPAAALDTLRQPGLVARLADPTSSERQQPPYATNWSRAVQPEFAVLVGICTHLGCIPEFRPEPDQSTRWPGGYFCPCHGSKYDLAGRVFRGVPAPYNLPVPPYHFVGKTTLRIGENPPGVKFDFGSIVQV